MNRTEYSKKYYLENRDAMLVSQRRGDLKRNFGITPEDWDNMFTEQKSRCAICGKHQSEQNKRFCVDHCHETGRVRGLLCYSCNIVLGHVKDDIDILLNAIEYLRGE